MNALLTRRHTQPIDYRGVPLKYHPKLVRGQLVPQVSAVCRSLTDCSELDKWFGDAEFCPLQPVLLLIPGHPVLLVGMGYATVAELRDDAENLWGKYTERLERRGSIVDFDELREKARLPKREDVKALTAEAFKERINQHRANPVTDPPRQPCYVRPNGRTVFAVDGLSDAGR